MGKRIGIVFLCLILSGWIHGQETVPVFPFDSLLLECQPVDFNSEEDDFSPHVSGGDLYFVSSRDWRLGIKPIPVAGSSRPTDIFVLKNMNEDRKPNLFSNNINTLLENEGPLCFSKYEDEIYFTRNLDSTGRNGKRSLVIFYSKLANDKWTKPEILPFCLDGYNYCHPALSPGGTVLIFSSDRPDGKGGMDIYYSRKVDGKWTTPENMGSAVNTFENELFPFLSRSNMLFFSSDRNSGKGGLDIYVCKWFDPDEAQSYLLPNPVNSSEDDFGFWCDSLLTNGYFSSNRKGSKGDDIYSYRFRWPVFDSCIVASRPALCYTFYEESSMQGLDTSGMYFEWIISDGTKLRGLEVKHCFASPGSYQVDLNIMDKSTGSLFLNQVSYNLSIDPPAPINFQLEPTVLPGSKVILDAGQSFLPGYRIMRYYWETGDGHYYSGKRTEHIFVNDGVFFIKVGVLARNNNTKQLKLFCGERKLKVMIPKGFRSEEPGADIDTTLLLVEGGNLFFKVYLGSSRVKLPLDSKMFEGLKDVGEVKKNDSYYYTSGSKQKLVDITPYYRAAKKLGFKDAVVVGYMNDSLVSNQKQMTGKLPKQKKVKVGLLGGEVFFGKGQCVIPESYFSKLDSLARVIRSLDCRVEILGFADPTGSQTYNLELSNKRVKAVAEYLIKKGVPKKRFVLQPIGEIGHDEDSPELEEIYRKVQIYITEIK